MSATTVNGDAAAMATSPRLAVVSLVLAVLCACTAVAVVYSTHLSRVAYMEKSANQRFIDDLDMQWSRLQIEEGTFSEHGRIESAARDKLNMKVPGLQESILIPLHRTGAGE